jgi:predicted methyltransferase
VISEVTAAGFTLVGESDALHHASDDRTRSVFDVIVRGQTDEFMLKFQRP